MRFLDDALDYLSGFKNGPDGSWRRPKRRRGVFQTENITESTSLLLPCAYLGAEVELSDERERHVQDRHPDLLPKRRDKIAVTLAEPDQVLRSSRFSRSRSFVRWFDALRGGTYVVVVVVSEAGIQSRHWVITAYIARRLTGGEVEWVRS